MCPRLRKTVHTHIHMLYAQTFKLINYSSSKDPHASPEHIIISTTRIYNDIIGTVNIILYSSRQLLLLLLLFLLQQSKCFSGRKKNYPAVFRRFIVFRMHTRAARSLGGT